MNKIIVQNFLHDIPKFSTQKYSSNVIEKCILSKNQLKQKFYL